MVLGDKRVGCNVRNWANVDIAMKVQVTYNKLLHADKLLAALAIYQ